MLTAAGGVVVAGDVTDVYLPLAQFLTVHAAATASLRRATDAFFHHSRPVVPFVIGIAGSVAVGKSTIASALQALLRREDGSPDVELVTTDSFLFSNATLEARGLMERKGFPESYDHQRLIETLLAIKAGDSEVEVPVYSHDAYDIVPGELQIVHRPEIVIVEGLNVLQVHTTGTPSDHAVISDFFDFSIYVDAAEEDIEKWFYERVLRLRSTVLHEPDSALHYLALMPVEEVSVLAQQIWHDVNLVNLRENIAPTRSRAQLILEMGSDHRVSRVQLRQA